MRVGKTRKWKAREKLAGREKVSSRLFFSFFFSRSRFLKFIGPDYLGTWKRLTRRWPFVAKIRANSYQFSDFKDLLNTWLKDWTWDNGEAIFISFKSRLHPKSLTYLQTILLIRPTWGFAIVLYSTDAQETWHVSKVSLGVKWTQKLLRFSPCPRVSSAAGAPLHKLYRYVPPRKECVSVFVVSIPNE